MKVTKATLDAGDGTRRLPSVLLELSDGTTVDLPFGTRRLFLQQGLVYVGREDLARQAIVYPNGNVVSFTGLLKDPEAAKALLVFNDYMDGKIELPDGHILFATSA